MNKKYLIISFMALLLTILLVMFWGKYIKFSTKSKYISYAEYIKKEKTISTYNNPIIPDGFSKVETNEASWEKENGIPKGWNDGLVIEDTIGNQFVWVPVNLEKNNYSAQDIKWQRIYNKNKMDISSKEDMQILKYGGFYIARYESSLATEIASFKEYTIDTNNVIGKPRSMQDKPIWNNIDWKFAKQNAQSMYAIPSLHSDLVTVKEWTAIMYWLREKGYDTKNSNNFGNYANNSLRTNLLFSWDDGKTFVRETDIFIYVAKDTYLLSSGANEKTKTCNIYDLAGNLAEFSDAHVTNINGKKETNYYILGGHYQDSSTYGAESMQKINSANHKQGFRVVLYQNSKSNI